MPHAAARFIWPRIRVLLYMRSLWSHSLWSQPSFIFHVYQLVHVVDRNLFVFRYNLWPVAYHGTKSNVVSSILEQSFRPSTRGCFFNELSGMHALYLSPSIEYAGHPRYAEPIQRGNKWVQVVLQVRVNPHLLYLKRKGTLKGAFPKDAARADPHYSNEELEWVLPALPGTHLSADSVVINGIMLRVTDEHPMKLTCTQWWGPNGAAPPSNSPRYSSRVYSKIRENCVIS